MDFNMIGAKICIMCDNAVDSLISNRKKCFAITVITGGVLLAGGTAWAINAPAAGSFAFDVYDIGVNKILNGPIGFVGGVGAMVVGAVMAVQQKIFGAIPCILGGGVMLNADNLVTSLGMMI